MSLPKDIEDQIQHLYSSIEEIVKENYGPDTFVYCSLGHLEGGNIPEDFNKVGLQVFTDLTLHNCINLFAGSTREAVDIAAMSVKSPKH